MSRFKSFLPYSACLLLALALCLQGVKYADTFWVWGMIALTFCAFGLLRLSLDWRRFLKSYGLEVLLFLWIIYSQWTSLDPAISLFPTTQAVIYLLLWVTLISARAHRPTLKTLSTTVFILGSLTIFRTLFQYRGALHNFHYFMNYEWAMTYGFLPINPTFNAIFMCSAAIILLASTPVCRIAGVGLLIMVLLGPSRSSLIALAVGLLYWIWPHITLRRMIPVLAGGVLLLAVMPSRFLESRLRLQEGNHRSKIWQIAIDAARERPVTGYGLGNFELAYQKYAFPVETDIIRYARTTSFAHNEFLQLLSDLGLPVFLLFLIMTFRILRRPVPKEWRPTKAALIALCATAVSAPIWHLPFLAYWSLLLAALVFTAKGETLDQQTRAKSSPISPRSILFGIAAFSSLSLCWCALRYTQSENNHWNDIVDFAPWDATAWQQVGYQTSEANASLAAFGKAVDVVPENPYFHESFARAIENRQTSTRRTTVAIEQYLLALQFAPHRAVNTLAIGRLLFLEGDTQTALAWMKAARRIEPHYWECDLWIARCWERLDNFKKARWVLRNLVRRREYYLAERQKLILDLPTNIDTSAYDQIILAYDSSVIDHELAGLK